MLKKQYLNLKSKLSQIQLSQIKRRDLIIGSLSLATVFTFMLIPEAPSVSPSSVAMSKSIYGEVDSDHKPEPQNLTVDSSAPKQVIERDSYSTISRTTTASYENFSPIFSNNTDAEVWWPFLTGVPISSTYGQRDTTNCDVCSSTHMGIDFTPGEGAQIQSIAAGVVKNVVNSTETTGYGTHVIIEHVIGGNTVTSLYAHMIPNSSPLQVGQTVMIGDMVGKVGNTGASTGTHLHFEVRVNGTSVDPYKWLVAHNK